jgi:hypothetical protein
MPWEDIGWVTGWSATDMPLACHRSGRLLLIEAA